MKKIGLWKKLASWLLVFLLVLQIPVNVFAEGWISETDISADNDFLCSCRNYRHSWKYT